MLLEARGLDMRAIADQLALTLQAAYQIRQRLANILQFPPKHLRRIALQAINPDRDE